MSNASIVMHMELFKLAKDIARGKGYEAGFRAGQEAMRERAAVEGDRAQREQQMVNTAIRALEIVEAGKT